MRSKFFAHERWSSVFLIGLLAIGLHLGIAKASLSQVNLLSSENPGGGPSIALSETTHDFGEVDEGVKVAHDFIVENKGNAELSITKVSPD
jgi:hypothetical protein